MTPTPCGFCGAPTYRLRAVPGYVVRAFDVTYDVYGDHRLDFDAALAYYDPPANAVQQVSGQRHQLHKETCPSWAGPVGG